DLPADRPSGRWDGLGAVSPYAFGGALEVEAAGGARWLGTATALSPHWVLTAGHNVDFDDDGRPDAGLTVRFHLPGFGVHTATGAWTAPGFSGFGQPSIHHDLALLYFEDPLPAGLLFPVLGGALEAGSVIALVGFGHSGYGSYGYTTQASLTDRRVGWNTVDALTPGPGGEGRVFRYTFDPPDSPRSLGNDLETIIGPGDSGGPALVWRGGTPLLVAVNTFTEGYGGRFGDIGGGIPLEAYWGWIEETTGLVMVPEPKGVALGLALLALVVVAAGRRPGRV
ncbi:MAG: hypothetical protein EA425_09260, partial [Puniceicoccaceae bacterium]